jgi:hypothetical protein
MSEHKRKDLDMSNWISKAPEKVATRKAQRERNLWPIAFLIGILLAAGVAPNGTPFLLSWLF